MEQKQNNNIPKIGKEYHMKNIKDDYVSFETAKLLKEKGFDVVTNTSYVIDNYQRPYVEIGDFLYNRPIESHLIAAPTLQMTMKWLREIHNKHCDVGYDVDLKWFFQIIGLKEIVEYDYPETKYYHSANEIGFDSYEEACKAAIKYCLENLI